MMNLNALGYFMDYCNREYGRADWVNQDTYEQGIREILDSEEGRFRYCRTAYDVLQELGMGN